MGSDYFAIIGRVGSIEFQMSMVSNIILLWNSQGNININEIPPATKHTGVNINEIPPATKLTGVNINEIPPATKLTGVQYK